MPERSNQQNRLTAVGVRNQKAPGRYPDGNGLYLFVRPSGSKQWIVRVMVQGRRRDIGLGSIATVSLIEAREMAASIRKTARAGGDPLTERRQANVTRPTFAEAARKVHADRKDTWKNPKHRAQWISTLETYVIPDIGDRRIDHIETADVLRVLSPIWLTKPETARRVRQRIGAVMDWARAAGHYEGENPINGVNRGLPAQNAKPKHHAAMPFGDIAGFMGGIPDMSVDPAVKEAPTFTILTAARTGETLGLTWDEIDLEAGLWTVPADRMKVGREHRVPLSAPALAALQRVQALSDGTGYIFPGRKHGKPLSNMAMAMAMRRAGQSVTVHGFRSSFSDWAEESTRFTREVVAASLAHTIENRVEAAYRRGDLLNKRRQLMAAWADYCTGAQGSVVALAPVRSLTR